MTATSKQAKYQKFIKKLSISVFILALPFNAYYVTGMETSIGSLSLVALLTGWLATLSASVAGISWLANPFLILSWIYIDKNIRISLATSTAALLFSILFLFADTIVVNENNNCENIISYGAGYYLWLASCCVIFLGSIFLQNHETATNRR